MTGPTRYDLVRMFVPSSNSVLAERYELIREIGSGGMGVVWLARQVNLGIECAVKFIHSSHAHDAELRRRFVREARAAASLRSPNSVNILDVDEWQGSLYIAMELLSGESLESRLNREGRISPELTVEIIEQVARGLNKAHAARLVHRDLKPDNIFLVDDEPLLVKILDFGIAKQLDSSSGLHTDSGALVGTPGYMSPEQADGGLQVDFRSDLWSLAVVAFRCLTGELAFDGTGLGQILLRIIHAPIPAPSSRNPSLPRSLDDWWFSVVQRDRSKRPESALALANGLRDAVRAGGSQAREAATEPLLPALAEQAQQVTLEPVSAALPRLRGSLVRYSVAATVLVAALSLVLARWLRSPSVIEPPAPAVQAARALPDVPGMRPAVLASPARPPASAGLASPPPAPTPVQTPSNSVAIETPAVRVVESIPHTPAPTAARTSARPKPTRSATPPAAATRATDPGATHATDPRLGF